MSYNPNTLKWSLLIRATLDPIRVQEMLSRAKTKEEEEMVLSVANEKIYRNHLYQVNVRELKGQYPTAEGLKPLTITHLSIKLRTKDIIKDWRHFQLIKNQLCGKESCAVEVYPPESKLVDTANQYHLYVFPDDSLFPFIFQERLLTESSLLGGKQRPFEIKPEDLYTDEAMKKKSDEHNYGAMI